MSPPLHVLNVILSQPNKILTVLLPWLYNHRIAVWCSVTFQNKSAGHFCAFWASLYPRCPCALTVASFMHSTRSAISLSRMRKHTASVSSDHYQDDLTCSSAMLREIRAQVKHCLVQSRLSGCLGSLWCIGGLLFVLYFQYFKD